MYDYAMIVTVCMIIACICIMTISSQNSARCCNRALRVQKKFMDLEEHWIWKHKVGMGMGIGTNWLKERERGKVTCIASSYDMIL